MANSADSLSRLAQFPELEDRLAAQGITISVRDHIRTAKLIEGLRKAKVVINTPEEAAGWLTPLLAQNEETARRVRETVKAWWRDQDTPSVVALATQGLQEFSEDPVQRRRILMTLVGIAAFAAVVAFAVLLGQTGAQNAALDEITNLPNPDVVEDQAPTAFEPIIEAEAPENLAGIILVRVFPALAILAPFGIAIWFLLRPPPMKVAERGAATRVKPNELRLKPVQTEVFVDSSSGESFRRLAAPDIKPTRHLDLPKSIKASIKGTKRNDLVFRNRFLKRRYVLIVEARGGEDHIHLVANGLVEQARMANIDITRYELRSHLSNLRYIDGGRQDTKSDTLGAIAKRHMGARLLILGSGERLFRPDGTLLTDIEGARPGANSSNMFGYFERPCLLTPTPMAFMGPRESRLRQAGLEIAPMSAEGLAHITEAMTAEDDAADRSNRLPTKAPREHPLFAWIRRSRVDMLSNIPPRKDELEDLGLDLRSYFRGSGDWPVFLGLMLMPTSITRSLTLSILHYLETEAQKPRIKHADKGGQEVVVRLPKHYSRLSTLARLARLPWFQVGYAPDRLRTLVIENSNPDEIAEMLNVLQRLLEDEGYLTRSDKSNNPALQEDEWVLKLFREDARGTRLASERELPLIKVMRNEELTDLAMPLPLRPRPRTIRLVAALVLGLAGVAAVAADGPETLLNAIAALLAPVKTAFDDITFNLNDFWNSAIWVIALAFLSFSVLDIYAAPEDAPRHWLARLMSPSRAFLAFAQQFAARHIKRVRKNADNVATLNVQSRFDSDPRQAYLSDRPISGVGLEQDVRQAWLEANAHRFAGNFGRRLSSVSIHVDFDTDVPEHARLKNGYDTLQTFWSARADRADRLWKWVGYALETVFLVFALGVLSSYFLEESGNFENPDNSVDALILFSWAMIVLALRVVRLGGGRAEPLVPWGIDADPNTPPSGKTAWFLRTIPLVVGSVAIIQVAPDVILGPPFLFMWISLGVLSAMILQTARTNDDGRGVRRAIGLFSFDFMISLGALGVTCYFLSEFEDQVLTAIFAPGCILLLAGHGMRLRALVLLAIGYADVMIMQGVLSELVPPLAVEADGIQVFYQSFMVMLIIGAVLFLKIPLTLARVRAATVGNFEVELTERPTSKRADKK